MHGSPAHVAPAPQPYAQDVCAPGWQATLAHALAPVTIPFKQLAGAQAMVVGA